MALPLGNKNYYGKWRAFSSSAAFYIRKKTFGLFMRKIRPTARDAILDLGITADILTEADNYFEVLYPFPDKITGAGVEDLSKLKTIYPRMNVIQADGRNLPFNPHSFDIVFSGSVLEHVGSRDDQRRFVSEALRVGKRVFISTPNRYFPLEVHTGLPLLHYLPAHIYRKILRLLGMHFFAEEENLNLLSKRDFMKLFDGEDVQFAAVKFLFFTVILVAIKK